MNKNNLSGELTEKLLSEEFVQFRQVLIINLSLGSNVLTELYNNDCCYKEAVKPFEP